MCPSAPRVCSEPGGQRPVLSLSLDLIQTYIMRWPRQDWFPAMKTQCLELMQVANIRNNYHWNLSTESRDNFKTGQHIRVTGPLWGETSVTGGFPSWRVSDAEHRTPEKLLHKQSSCQWLTRTDSSIGNGERHWAAWIVFHYSDVIMGAIASQITSLTIVYSTVYSSADQGKHQSSALLAFVRGIHRDRWIPRTNGQ